MDTMLDSSDLHRIFFTFAAVGLLLLAFVFQKNKCPTDKRRSPEDVPWQKIPGALPVVGNPIPGGIDNLYDTLEDWATKYGKKTGVYECVLFGTRTIVVCNQTKLTLLDKYRSSFKIQRPVPIVSPHGWHIFFNPYS